MNNQKTDQLKFTKSDFEKIREFLPINYVAAVADRIDNKISKRQVRFIINGVQKDKHGVIDALLTIAAEQKSALELQKERIKALTSK